MNKMGFENKTYNSKDVYSFLEKNNLIYEKFKHKPVYSCKDAKKEYSFDLKNTAHIKNIFLREKLTNTKKFYLFLIIENQKINFNEIFRILNRKLVFAKEEELKEILKVETGAVSIFSLLNDLELKTTIIINPLIFDYSYFLFHPNDNSQTVKIGKQEFEKILSLLKHEKIVIDM
jgi:Ala-tRNA(Pro) deacylase